MKEDIAGSSMTLGPLQDVAYVDVYPFGSTVEQKRTRITEARFARSTQPHGRGIRIIIDRECSQTDALEMLELYVAHAGKHGWHEDTVHETEPLSEDQLTELLMEDDFRRADQALKALRQRKGLHGTPADGFDDGLPF